MIRLRIGYKIKSYFDEVKHNADKIIIVAARITFLRRQVMCNSMDFSKMVPNIQCDDIYSTTGSKTPSDGKLALKIEKSTI